AVRVALLSVRAELHFRAVAIAEVDVRVLDECRPLAVGRSRIAEKSAEVGPLALGAATALSLPSLRGGIRIIIADGAGEPGRVEPFGFVVVNLLHRLGCSGRRAGRLRLGFRAGISPQVAGPIRAADGEPDGRRV